MKVRIEELVALDAGAPAYTSLAPYQRGRGLFRRRINHDSFPLHSTDLVGIIYDAVS